MNALRESARIYAHALGYLSSASEMLRLAEAHFAEADEVLELKEQVLDAELALRDARADLDAAQRGENPYLDPFRPRERISP